MKKMLAWSIACAFLSFAFISSSYAAPSDSTSGGFLPRSNTTSIRQAQPDVQLGSPYTAEEGHGPIAGIDRTTNTSGDPNSGSYLEVLDCNNSYCVVRSLTRKYLKDYQGDQNPDICPREMKPSIEVDPETATGSVGGFACLLGPGMGAGNYGVGPNNIGVPIYASDWDSIDEGHYWIYAVVSSRTYTSGSNINTVPGNGFIWKITCQPTNSTFVPYRQNYYNCVAPNVEEFKKPLEWEHGIINVSTSGNSHVVRTQRRCPDGKVPYAVATAIGPNNFTTSNNNISVLNSYSVCVRNIVNDTNTNYRITILYGAAITPIRKDGSSLTIDDADRSVSNGMLQIEYTLFCYPNRRTFPHDAVSPNTNPNLDNYYVNLYSPNSNGGTVNGPCNPNNPPYNGN